MKFLLEFVSCYGCASSAAANSDSVNGGVVVVVEFGPCATSQRSEETRSLVNSQRRSKRGRVVASRCGAARGGVLWRPSLHSINEDHVVMTEKLRRSEVERTVKRNGRVRDGSDYRGRDGSFGGDNGRNSFPAMQALAPTPFMF